jgi:mRNA interferase MazF
MQKLKEYVKDFAGWFVLKKRIDASPILFYAHPREVWWCSLGVNIGAEIDGKHETFERPVLVMRVYSTESQFVLPLTTVIKDDDFHFKIATQRQTAWAKLTQGRVISTKRLLRKVDVVDSEQFNKLREALRRSL